MLQGVGDTNNYNADSGSLSDIIASVYRSAINSIYLPRL